jgi:putative ABC transport system permease protein
MGQQRKTAALIVVTAILGIAIAWAPMAIGSRSLHAPTLPAVDVGTPLAEPVITPMDIRDIGTATLSGVNYLLAAGSLVVCFCALVVLSFMRAASRSPEILIHRAVGASRKRLVLAGARESWLLALPAVVLGSVVGFFILKYAVATWPGTFDGRGFGPVWLPAVVGLTIALGILIPLKSLGEMQPAVPPLGPLIAPVLCALQLAVCFAVMVNARQVVHEAKSLLGTVRGGASEGRLFQLEIPAAPAERSRQFAELIRRSGVADLFDIASISSPGALEGLGTVSTIITECGACSQGGIGTPLRPVPASLSIVSADTFRALNTTLIEGRWLSDKDDWNAKRVAVITQALARAHFQNGEALGRRIQVGEGKNNRFTVVGVVEERKLQGLGGALQPAYDVYASVLQLPPTIVDFLVRPRRAVAWPGILTWFPEGSLKEALSEKQWRARIAAPIGWFGGALLFNTSAVVFLALLGIACSMAIWVGAMLPELAIRRAVGARRRDVLGHVAYRSAKVAIAGVLLGLLLAELTAGPISAIVPGIAAFDTAGVIQIALLTIAVMALGVSVPAWRACRLEPVEVLSKHGDAT